MMIDLLGSSLKDLQQTVKDIPLDIVIDLGCQIVRVIILQTYSIYLHVLGFMSRIYS